MKRKFLLIPLIFLANACAMNNNFSPEQSLNIDYMQTADAVFDAKQSIANNNFSLIGFDQRGLIIPGVKNTFIKSIQNNCPVIRINGIGDVVKSSEHLIQMKKVRAYSKAYNMEILNAASCHKQEAEYIKNPPRY